MTIDEANNIWTKLINNANAISAREKAFSMRQRLNPHHVEEHKREESRKFKALQYTTFQAIKHEYVKFRDELIEFVGDIKDRAEFVKAMDHCITEDFEEAFLE